MLAAVRRPQKRVAPGNIPSPSSPEGDTFKARSSLQRGLEWEMRQSGLNLKLLVLDDDRQVLDTTKAALASHAVDLLVGTNADAGLALFLDVRPSIVMLDLQMPGTRGIELLEKMISADPGVDVVITTSQYSTDLAIEAIQKGACDFLVKPLDPIRLRHRIDALVSQAEERQRACQLDRELVDIYQFQGIVGRSPAILQVFAKIRRVAPHFRNVLITGETGTGKELVARALHKLSPASSGPFAICNCSALVPTLLESELFGHVRGAFTGATHDKLGIFEYAHGGVVFLDEIGELPLVAQAKLLRILQSQELQRVGSPVTRTVNVRVVAATHRDLRTLISKGEFREDLFHRLAMIEIELPRLAERKEDLPLLQRHLVSRFSDQYQKNVSGITRRAQALLVRYHWPGNVRELENVIGNACMMSQGNVIDIHDLPEYMMAMLSSPKLGDPELITFAELQRRHLIRVLEKVGGNKVQAAEVLGVSRATIYEMLAKMKPKPGPDEGKQAKVASFLN